MKKQNYITAARASLKMTQKEFAEAAGVSHPTIVALEGGTRKPSVAVIEKVERLLRGHGLIGAPWTPDEADLLYRYRQLSSDNKTHVLGVVRGLTNV
ncbi:MAG: helix-turn-helix transcriptional regulator [Prevotellaceae bacterium]|nr:helix-turn-helix transcriptional regulator [Prevotellaceae bacterium]